MCLKSSCFVQFGELPFHLVRSKRFTDLYENVLFNYQWLHAKLSSCPLQAVLSDFEDACANIEDRDITRYIQKIFYFNRINNIYYYDFYYHQQIKIM